MRILYIHIGGVSEGKKIRILPLTNYYREEREVSTHTAIYLVYNKKNNETNRDKITASTHSYSLNATALHVFHHHIDKTTLANKHKTNQREHELSMSERERDNENHKSLLLSHP